MLKPQIFIISLFAFLACNQPISTPQPTEAIAVKAIESAPLLEVDLTQILEEGGLAKVIAIDVLFDPVFKRPKKYEAIPLKPFLRKAIATQNLDTANTEIIFLCKDGYNPGMTLSRVLQNEPYLAIKDLEATNGKNWMDTLQGKWAPFYLVWPNNPKGTKGYTWPYGLKYLQFKAADEAYKAATPIDKNQLAGFQLYQSKCMKCHSINKVGGIMGPEMNVPKNITEYWKEADIRAFVKNPYSYRYNSKMPPVEGITDKQIDKILAYLKYMKSQKIELD